MNTKARRRKAGQVAQEVCQTGALSPVPSRRVSKTKRAGKKRIAPKEARHSRGRVQVKRTKSLNAPRSAKPGRLVRSMQADMLPISSMEPAAKGELFTASMASENSSLLFVAQEEVLQPSTVEPTTPDTGPAAIVYSESNPGSIESSTQLISGLEENSTAGGGAVVSAKTVETPAGQPWARGFLYLLQQNWLWVKRHIKVRRVKKRLRVCETVSLGDKRFVAVIQVDGEEFLVGGASNSVSTLARLEHPQDFSTVLRQRWAEEPAQA